MLLKSSSTPILGSLLSSSSPIFSESPKNGFQVHHYRSLERSISSSSFLHGISCQYFPLPDSSDRDPSTGMRRTRSEGNIKDFLSKSQRPPKASSSRRGDPVLEGIPSFSMCDSRGVEEEEEEQQAREGDEISAEFSFSYRTKTKDVNQNAGELNYSASHPLFLAKGLGIDPMVPGFINLGGDGGFIGGGDGRDGNYSVKTDYGGEGYDVEVHYKRMIEEDPSNSLLLRNYAQFLHQDKRDLERAEEYYSRAILCDPGDADTISQYGKLIWELHHDYNRASNYLERVPVFDFDSFVQAAYASFLWETCEEDEIGEDNYSQGFQVPSDFFNQYL